MRLKYKNKKLHAFVLLLATILQFNAQPLAIRDYSTVTCGAARFGLYLPMLKDKRVGVVTNITGVIGRTSIVDTLVSLKVKVKKIFGPEHGFRSDTEAGEKVKSNRDKKTGIPVISLYGANKKPAKEQLKDVDILIYDIQDVGVRFYTYISTLCYVMEACAENGKQLIVLDRPNPNGFYIDGPVLTDAYKSFLGLHNVPLVYGMTTGEYAQMANNEGWLAAGVKCSLTVIPLKDYDRSCSYKLPVKPSPNLPDEIAVLLYPSLGLFEGSIMSVGRGTQFPFKVTGHPEYPDTSFSFIPLPTKIAKEPKYVNRRCYGLDLRHAKYITDHPRQITLEWLIRVYDTMKRDDFFDKNFNYHVGNGDLQEQLKYHVRAEEIRKDWNGPIAAFRAIRKKYLIYPDCR
jgi:uncharacterized protein YbbC (DUF1343 family)